MYKIGIKANHYPEKRNFTELPFRDFRFEKKIDIYRVINHLYFKIKKRNHPQWLNLFYDLNIGNYDCLHFFNAVSLGKKPWITTVECYLPRGANTIGLFPHENKYINRVLNRLADPTCKKIVALSQFAIDFQTYYLRDIDKALVNKILSKIELIHPSQSLNIESFSQKKLSDEFIQLTFVGADFFRKGGKELLMSFEKLTKKGIKVQLTIVSSLQYGDYASATTKNDRDEALDIISKNDLITYHKKLPNDKVIDLLKRSDMAILPSYDETYGYFVLEAQSCGCPIITTNGGALTEINNNDCGWIIDVELENGRSIPRTPSKRERFTNEVVSQTVKIIEEVSNNREIIKDKGQKALERIKTDHSIENNVKRLESIYLQAIKK